MGRNAVNWFSIILQIGSTIATSKEKVWQVPAISCVDEADKSFAHKASHLEKVECAAISLVQACGRGIGLKTEVPVL